MDKLNQLLSGNVLDFAATFGAANREWIESSPTSNCPVWLEGWAAPARAGYVLGDGEFIHEGRVHRFYFSGLPLRHCQGAPLSGRGTVLGLRQWRDFSGVYMPWDGVPSHAGCATELQWKNVNGVVIALTTSAEDWVGELPEAGLRVRLATYP